MNREGHRISIHKWMFAVSMIAVILVSFPGILDAQRISRSRKRFANPEQEKQKQLEAEQKKNDAALKVETKALPNKSDQALPRSPLDGKVQENPWQGEHRFPRKNFSTSISENDTNETVSVSWRKDKANIVYSIKEPGQPKKVTRLTVRSLDELKEKNPRALELLEMEVDNMVADGKWDPQNGKWNRNGSNSSPGERRALPGMQANGAFAWQRAGMTNNNRQIQRFNRSGGGPLQMNGGINPEQLLQQVIQQTNDPVARQQLQRHLELLRRNRR